MYGVLERRATRLRTDEKFAAISTHSALGGTEWWAMRRTFILGQIVVFLQHKNNGEHQIALLNNVDDEVARF